MLKQFIAGLVLCLGIAVQALAGTLTVDLYRSGNASSPRMDNVRTTDVVIYKKDGIDWVKAKQNGISTTSEIPANQKNWWKVPKGTFISNDIYVVNDHGNHWAWAPAKDMPLANYIELMKATNSKFTKLK